ncbi:GNAT family N-acetyltransferase [Pelagibius sp.]|uniref:GNAT family N-acetyltransferase n=1 Tax=Pelagibius sp. TaxID=1931238 RepID=UPI003BAF31B6
MAVPEAQILYSPSPDDDLQLVAIDVGNYAAVVKLKVAESQESFVANNAVSIVQGHYHPGAWFRAAYLNGEAIGFVMLFDPRGVDPVGDDPGETGWEDGLVIWRLMIGREHQGQGLGRRLMEKVIALARTNGFERLYLTFVDAEGGPEPFYLQCGFARTGRVIDGEVEAVLELA